jgi:hypothetical protein
MNNTSISSDDIYIYRIDNTDTIIYVSDNWTEFSMANGASERCSKPLVLGKSLWGFISDVETRHIYKLVLKRIREKLEPAVIPGNCDSPKLKRVIQITISPMDDGAIEFSSKIVKLIHRDCVKILDASIERSDDIVKICSFCKKIAVSETEWAETQQAITILDLFGKKQMPQLTHGVCPSCSDTIMAELDK